MMLLTMALGCCLAAEPDRPAVRYVRPAAGKWVLECEVSETRGDDGLVYVSRTERGPDKMTLTVRYDKAGKLVSAEALHETPKGKKTATLTLQTGDNALLKRSAGIGEFFKLPADPVVTTAPDWSDIFLLVRRYDAAKGGKQEFNGLWIHPTEPMLMLKFTIERQETETVKHMDKALPLERYRVKLRSGEYHVWADKAGRVFKLQAVGARPAPVVLEGYEEATRELGSKQ